MKIKTKKIISLPWLLCIIILFITVINVNATTIPQEIKLNTQITDRISNAGETKKYDFSIPSPGKIDIQFDFSDNANGSWFVDLYDANGKNLYLNLGNAITSSNKDFYNKRLPSGNYSLEIKPAYFISEEYTLKVIYNKEDISKYENEYNNDFKNANTINMDNDIIGNIDSPGDKDYFKFNLNDSKILQVKFKCPSNSEASWILGIYNADGKMINYFGSTSNYTSNDILFNSIELSKGEYFLKIETGSLNYKEENANLDYSFRLQEILNPIATDAPDNSKYTCSSWAKEEIEKADSKNLIPDTIKNKDLREVINRSEFAAIAVELYQVWKNYIPSTPSKSSFTDISGNENEAYIKKAYNLNITNGMSKSEFSPYQDINREQLATMLARTIKKIKFDKYTINTDKNYYFGIWSVKKFDDDYLISDYAKNSVYFLADRGVVKGTSEKPYLFSPKESNTLGEAYQTVENAVNAFATREQAIVMSLRIYKDKPSILDEVYKN